MDAKNKKSCAWPLKFPKHFKFWVTWNEDVLLLEKKYRFRPEEGG